MINLQNLHTFHLISHANNISEVTSVSDLECFVGQKNIQDFLMIGSGSNCVFVEDYQGTVVINKILGKTITEFSDHFVVNVSAGENWHEFVKWTVDNELYGLENLALIPGTVGASPIQNIGAYGVEVARFIEKVTYFDLETGVLQSLENDDCQFGYRSSIFKHELKERAIITEVTFKLPKKWSPCLDYGELKLLLEPSARDIFEKVIEIRTAKLPNPDELGNAGSFYKNPVIDATLAADIKQKYSSMPVYPVADDDSKVKVAAGWLIEHCGLKGYKKGNVAVHDKQALVLVNITGQATGAELVSIALFVQASVWQTFGILLEPEVRIIASNGEVQLASYKESNE